MWQKNPIFPKVPRAILASISTTLGKATGIAGRKHLSQRVSGSRFQISKIRSNGRNVLGRTP